MNNQRYYNERGQAMIQIALSFVALILCTGLAVDVGQMNSERSYLQKLADAGAQAGAREICRGRSASDAITAAQDYAGPRSNVLQITAIVSDNKVVVTVTTPITCYFSQLVGLTSTNMRAVGQAACGTGKADTNLSSLAPNKVSWDASAEDK